MTDQAQLGRQAPGTDQFQALTAGGRDEFSKELNRFTTDLLLEAGRVENGEHVGDAPIEITAHHVSEAIDVVRRPVILSPETPKRWPDRLLAVGGPVSGGAAGVLGGYLTLGWGQALAFGVAATVSLVCLIWALGRSR